MGKKDIGRIVTGLLRHSSDEIGLKRDKAGYCDINDLIDKIAEMGRTADKEMIYKIGEDVRFSFNESRTKIRADYGTSCGLKLKDMYDSNSEPPEMLYHGTHLDVINNIKNEGIIRYPQMKNARDHIFLTDDIEVATKKGFRHGESVVLPVMARRMHEDGYLLYHAKNDIWLIEDTILPKYIDFKNMII